ncbi:hypothetical protein [Nostoc sp. MG11]|uniref:hypothetical protein n=1 Tax=Nostoc sp. MG11 TaxID=2721166 RepID=UPI001D030CCE|nr:hypothetical protein [Nostoc sp. MG11]
MWLDNLQGEAGCKAGNQKVGKKSPQAGWKWLAKANLRLNLRYLQQAHPTL